MKIEEIILLILVIIILFLIWYIFLKLYIFCKKLTNSLIIKIKSFI